jgi:hypothetical protein
MSLQQKLLHLKLEAALALRHAQGWQKLIDLYGEQKATEFYQHLGLNHLPAKSYDYDGLTLSREPKPHEMLHVKAIASAQDSAKERLSTMMLAIRNELINDAIERLANLSPAKYHTLIVSVDQAGHILLRDLVSATFNDGRLLISTQRGIKQDDDIDLDDELDDLTTISEVRLANDVQARITGAATRYAMLGQSGMTLINSVTNDINSGSVAYIDRISTGLANRTLNLGRSAEAAQYAWERIEYSSLLDVNTCSPCAEADGETATDESDLTPAPNPSCEGGDWCKCFHIFISD